LGRRFLQKDTIMEFKFSLPFVVEAPTEQEARTTAAHVRQNVAGLALNPAITRVDAPDLAGDTTFKFVVVKDEPDKAVATE
jgi:hypothetical protein